MIYINIRDEWIDNNLPNVIYEYSRNDISNADEIALFFKCLPLRTLAFKNGKWIIPRVKTICKTLCQTTVIHKIFQVKVHAEIIEHIVFYLDSENGESDQFLN